MSKLRISADLSLPPEAVTETFAILAKRGAGKTYTAAVLVEELAAAGMQFVVVDPIGVWWGLRSSSDGKQPGIPVVVLGGDHGDVPLEVAGGTLAADLIVDEGLSLVLDLGRFRKGEQIRFMTDFAERLYHRNRSPLHLVLDEADAFAPQKPRPEGARLLGAVEDLVRRGRARGIGVTLVTQRSAVLNKDVLTQAEVLVALRTTHPRDREAIEEWAKAHGTTEQLEELRDTLAGLPVGEAWFWSPGWLDVFKRVRIRERQTFDSSATPKVGEKPRAPKKLADVDLEQLRERMAAAIEKAKAEDPAELRKQLVALRKELDHERRAHAAHEGLQAREAAIAAAQAEPKIVEVPALSDEDLAALRQVVDQVERYAKVALTDLAKIVEQLPQAVAPIAAGLDRVAHASRGKAAQQKPTAVKTATTPAKPRPVHEAQSNGRVSGPQQRILNALAQLQTIGVYPVDKTQLALFAEASPRSSAYSNNLGALRSVGLVDYPAPAKVALTDAGAAIADASSAPTSTHELHAYVAGLVGGAKWRLLEQLIDAYPEALPKAELAERAGASATSSAFSNNLGSLRSLGLIDYPSPGYVAALPVLFLEG